MNLFNLLLGIIDHRPSESLDGQSFGEWVSENTGLFIAIMFAIIFVVFATVALVLYSKKNSRTPQQQNQNISGKFCIACGKPLADGTSFCGSCGNKISS